MKEFKVNEYITLKLENDITNIYVNNVKFNQCKHLLFNLFSQNTEKYENIDSIDEAEEKITGSSEVHYNQMSGYYDKSGLTPETIFWGHCSNLQTWALNAIKEHLKGNTVKTIQSIKRKYSEPILALQEEDLEFPNHVRYAYYSIYNFFCILDAVLKAYSIWWNKIKTLFKKNNNHERFLNDDKTN